MKMFPNFAQSTFARIPFECQEGLRGLGTRTFPFFVEKVWSRASVFRLDWHLILFVHLNFFETDSNSCSVSVNDSYYALSCGNDVRRCCTCLGSLTSVRTARVVASFLGVGGLANKISTFL